MRLEKLLSGIVDCSTDLVIRGLSLHSAEVLPDYAFCLLTERIDGKDKINAYIKAAVDNGATCLLTDKKITSPLPVPYFYVPHLAQKLTILAKRFYPNCEKATIIAVTGTNGKTSVAFWLMQTLQALEQEAAYIGTLGVESRYLKKPLSRTTPNIFSLSQTVDSLVKQGIDYVVLEASSHALVQNRLAALTIKHAIFTNLSQDHLDYHETMSAYQLAKEKLFQLPSLKTMLVCSDDLFGQYLLSKYKELQPSAYGLKPLDLQSDGLQSYPYQYFFTFDKWQANANGFTCQIANTSLQLPLLATFNLLNVLAVVGQLKQLGFACQAVVKALAVIEAIAGRMEKVVKEKNIYLDYAHTPDALAQSLQALKLHFPKKRIILVFGCGGNRDRSKRPLMGAIAQRYADEVILTNDNPRDELPLAIIADIKRGFQTMASLRVVVDRKEAIATAMNKLTANDCLLIAGKGAETTQIIEGSALPFDDRVVVKSLL